jgi:hypothetical protein
MRILVGEPISTAGKTDKDMDQLIDEARHAVVDLKDELDGKTYARPLRATG